MSLTTGHGPLSPRRAGRFTRPSPTASCTSSPTPGGCGPVAGDRWVIDTEGAVLVHRPGRPPSWAFPAADAASIDGAEAVPEAPGHVAVPWNAVDAWFEEEEEVFFHPRNPYHRVDCVPSRRRLTVTVAGIVLVDTDETTAVYETSLARRLYVPRHTVRMDLLVPSPTTTYCPYKGTASYWTAVVDGERTEDVAWSYDDPTPRVPAHRRPPRVLRDAYRSRRGVITAGISLGKPRAGRARANDSVRRTQRRRPGPHRAGKHVGRSLRGERRYARHATGLR